MAVTFTKFLLPLIRTPLAVQMRKCHSVFGITDLLEEPKLDNFSVSPVHQSQQQTMVKLIKEHYLRHHALVVSRNMALDDDRSLDEYLIGLLKQGNSLLAKDDDGTIAGFCVNFACSPVDSNNLRHYAFYRQANPHGHPAAMLTANGVVSDSSRLNPHDDSSMSHTGRVPGVPEGIAPVQLGLRLGADGDVSASATSIAGGVYKDPNMKDLLHFIAKLQETPNLWELFKEKKIFEVKMLAVVPGYRRRGLGTLLLRRARSLARDQGYTVLRMDCLNAHDYKIAERCMLQCIAKFPLHKLRGPHAPFIKKHSEHNRRVRVYVDPHVMKTTAERDGIMPRVKEIDVENTIE